MDRDNYYLILRILAVVMAISLWALSVRFSNDGFNFSVDDMAWAAWILAISVTVLELIWTKQGFKPNITIFIFGLGAYGYGIYTNVLGISDAMNINAVNNPLRLIFPAVLGVFLEVIPEPLAIWGLLGAESEEGDFISTLFGRKGKGFVESFKPQYNQQPQKQMGFIPANMQSQHDKERAEALKKIAEHRGGTQSEKLPPFHATERPSWRPDKNAKRRR